jgi:phage tail-like protein
VSREDANNFSYLNRAGRWPDFEWRGLELRADGALRLCALPRLEGASPDELGDALAPDGPAGIVVAADGSIYFSDPAGHRILRIDGCDGELDSVRCLGGQGGAPTQLHTPRGLLIPGHRPQLFVADSGNHRLQVFDPASGQIADSWGQPSVAGSPQPGAATGRFDTPWALAGDDDGNVYVVDYGAERAQKFNRAGDVIPAFWNNLQASGLRRPVDIAAATAGGTTTLYIVAQDAMAQWQVFICDAAGRPALDAGGRPITFGAGQLLAPMGIAADAEAVYVGDNNRRRVLVFKRDDFKQGGQDGTLILAGEAVGYQGPVAALALDACGGLLTHTGAARAPVRLAIDRGYSARGVLWSRAITAREYEHEAQWHRLQAVMEELAPGAQLRLFVHTADDPADAPVVNPDDPNPFADQRWRPQMGTPDQFAGLSDLFIGGQPAKYLWIGALFLGDGEATPVLTQLRVEFDHETYLKHLPAIYRGQTLCGDSLKRSLALFADSDHRANETLACGDFLKRFLALFESLFAETEEDINALARLFDPAAAPAQFLPWLAGWLALELDEDWDEVRRRQMIATAFERYSRRGTAEGLRESLRLFAGVEAIVEEPILNAAWWALPAVETSCEGSRTACRCGKAGAETREPAWAATENSILGVTTMLAPAHPQGAALGSTATLDHSSLITDEEFGAPLFTDVAHQFSVQVYRGQLGCAETLSQVRAVIEREKPAHTAYHLCVIEPRLRVGFQARVGIDAVVAGGPAPGRLSAGMILGADAALGGQPAGRLGEQSRVGITTRIG